MISTDFDRRGTNPFADIKLLLFYMKTIRKIKPTIVLTYTIKPNIYGGIASALSRTRYVANITGLGTAIENEGIIKKVTLQLYRIALYKSARVFFQNKANQILFKENRIKSGRTKLIPGSGVNLNQHTYEEYPINDKTIRFLFIGRIMKAKGINELLDAAQIIKNQFPNVQFDLIGGIEENYIHKLNAFDEQGIIKYHGLQEDVHSFIKNSHATIHPSYHEGLANVLLETASSGRPVLASKIPGCVETFDDGMTGIGFEARDVNSLVSAIKKFLSLSYEEKKAMGKAGRKKMEQEFDREIVTNAYLKEIYDYKGNSYESI